MFYFIFLIPLFLFSLPQNRSPSPPFVSGDGFRAHCDYRYDETHRYLNPADVKPNSSIFVKTDYIREFFTRVHPRLPGPYILVTHNSDYGVPGDSASFLDDEKLIAWFGQNVEAYHPKLHPIPIGIANQYWEHGNPHIVKRVQSRKIEKAHLLYYNISVQNFPPERSLVERLLSHASYTWSQASRPFEQYLEDLAASQFVLSPRGNGLDTHRLWETLYMGSYPIVKASPIDPLYEGLPVVIIQSWEEVNEEFLKKKQEEFSKEIFSMENITLKHWTDLIDSYKSR